MGCIKAAKEMGCHTIVTDRNPKAPGLAYADIPMHCDITDVDGCRRIAEQYAIDGIVAVNDYGVMTAASVSESLGLSGLPVPVARIATDKYLMRKAWERYGAPTVQYMRVNDFEEFKTAIGRLSFPSIVKPCNSQGGGSRGVMHLDENTDLHEAYRFATGYYDDPSLIVEKFVVGLEHSVEAIVWNGKSHVIAISDKIKSPLPFRVDDTILYPTVENGQRLEWIIEAVQKAVSAIGMVDGMAHVELCITDNGPVLFELGARCGGGAPAPLVPYLCGVDEFKEAVRIAFGQKPHQLSPQFMKGCAAKFFYPKPGIVTHIKGIDKIENIPGILSFGIFVKEGDAVRTLKTCSDRAGMVITGGETRQIAHDLANFVLDSVTIETKPPT